MNDEPKINVPPLLNTSKDGVHVTRSTFWRRCGLFSKSVSQYFLTFLSLGVRNITFLQTLKGKSLPKPAGRCSFLVNITQTRVNYAFVGVNFSRRFGDLVNSYRINSNESR